MSKPSLLVIFVTVFIDLIGFGIVLPLLPRYAQSFGARGVEIGLIISSFSVMQFVLAPVWGRLSDRIGRRPVILIGNAGSALSYAMFGYAGGLSGSAGLFMVLLSRIFAGACGATISVASAYIADITSVGNRSKGMGLIGMAFGLGFILGPAIGGVSAAQFGMGGPGWVAAGLCGANFLVACVILKESLRRGSAAAAPRPRLDQLRRVLRHPRLGVLIVLFFLATFAFTAFESTLPLLLDETLNYRPEHIYYLFAYCGLIAAVVQGGLVGRMIRWLGEARLVVWSLAGVALSLVLIPAATTVGVLLFVLGLFAAASGLNRPPTMGLISVNASEGEQGATMGIAQSASTVARILGPIVATWLYGRGPATPYYLAAVVAAIGGVVAWQYLCRADEMDSRSRSGGH